MAGVHAIVGGALCAMGIVLSVRSMLLLSGRGRPRRGPRPVFVIAGPYRRMRNPLLGGLVLAVAGAALASRSLALGFGGLVGAIVAHAWVVLAEEPRLTARFGLAYEAYVRRVPRWLPGPVMADAALEPHDESAARR